jgi:hypothetical protein
MFGVNTALAFVIQGLTFSRWYVLDCCDTVCLCQSLIFLIISARYMGRDSVLATNLTVRRSDSNQSH